MNSSNILLEKEVEGTLKKKNKKKKKGKKWTNKKREREVTFKKTQNGILGIFFNSCLILFFLIPKILEI